MDHFCHFNLKEQIVNFVPLGIKVANILKLIVHDQYLKQELMQTILNDKRS